MPDEPHADAKRTTDEAKYRYRVLSTWGKAPEEVTGLIGSEDGFLVYPDYRGIQKSESIVDMRTGHVLGGWTMQYAGQRESAYA